MLESCMRPELVVEITLQPVRRYGVDAAIFFSDIVLPLEGGRRRPRHQARASARWSPSRCARWPTSRRSRTSTPEHVAVHHRVGPRAGRRAGPTPLIGFAGAPFTVASYLVEGGPSKEHAKTKAMMFGAPERLGRADAQDRRDLGGVPARCRSEAGASAVQLFDSWAGALTPADYPRYVHAALRARCSRRSADLGVPRIHFGVGTGELLGLMGEAGADVVGVDWRVPLADGARPRSAAGSCRATSTRRWCSRRPR